MAWMNDSSLYVLVVLSFIILKVNAKQTCVTVQVRAEYFQQSLLESSVYEKRIRSSSSFRSNYNQLSLSAKVSGSFKLFSASAQASYERVTSSVSQSSQNEHTEKSESLTFNSDFLQIVRKITTGVTIGGSTAQTEIRELVDSVDKTKPKTDSQLRKLETDYLRRYFGNDVEIAGHAYTETKCIDVIDVIDVVTCPDKEQLSLVLLENNWRTQNQINAMSEEDKRNTVIVEVEKMTGHTIGDLQGRANAGDLGSLTAIANMAGLLIKYSIRSSSQVKTMTYEPHLRNILIVEISQRFSITVSSLQSKTDQQLLKTFCTDL